jgi:hypothetical protein
MLTYVLGELAISGLQLFDNIGAVCTSHWR